MRYFLLIAIVLAGCATVKTESVEYAQQLSKEGRAQEAVQIYSRLANGGDAHAQFQLADLYYSGSGVPQNKFRASDLWRQSCEGGFWRACNRYAATLENIGEHAKAEKLYLRNIEQHKDKDALQNLISLYRKAEWSGRSEEKARKYENLYESWTSQPGQTP